MSVNLLQSADKRPFSECWVWFVDGFLLFKHAPRVWLQVASIGFGMYLATMLVAGLIATLVSAPFSGNVQSLIARVVVSSAQLVTMVTVFFMAFVVCNQVLIQRSSVVMKACWWEMWNVLKRRDVQNFVGRLVGIDAGLIVVGQFLFPNSGYELTNQGQIVITNINLLLMNWSWMVFTMMIVWSVCWAILPVLASFPAVRFDKALWQLQIEATLKNIPALLGLMGLFFITVAIVIVVSQWIGMVSAILMLLVLMAVLMLIMLPVAAGWLFSAARHIVMDW